tara:strand:- start:10760 stop:11038 length:279 start_codon:yes stop_codon:yes gene_type:complete
MGVSYVYILTNKNKTTLYIGVTNNLKRRLGEHQNGIGSVFTKKYNVHCLVYFEEFPQILNAIEREKPLKGWTRLKKEKLIEKMNPDWAFLVV